MMFRLPRLSALILARGLGAICAAFFLCSSVAWAQNAPPGHVATREGDVVVMRPSAPANPDIAIRVYPPIIDNEAADAVLRRWAESHPVPGVDPSALRVQSQTVSGVSSLSRAWKDGVQVHVEIILMPPAGPGRYQPVVAGMPTQPEPIKKHSEAVGYVMAQIMSGKPQPNIPADGKGNPVASAMPVEPAGNRTATQRPASGRAASGTGMQAATEQVSRLAAEIETVGFVTRGHSGVGGMWIYVPIPVVLFRSGDALLDMGYLSRVASMDADRATHPKDWGRWRRSAGSIELLQEGKWKKLNFPRTVDRLPAGFVLSGQYDYLSGGGDTAIGGGFMFVSNRSYTFRSDGRYSSNKLGFLSNNDQMGSVVARSQSPDLVGRYSVDGYLLRLEPPGAPPETHVLVFDPKDPTAIWIDGHGYTRAQ